MMFMLRKNIIMKNKILPVVILILFFSTKSFSQTTMATPAKSDSASASRHNDLKNQRIYQAKNTAKHTRLSNAVSATTYSAGANSQEKTPALVAKKSTKKPMYRDTRLGGSSKKYNTYKKNDNGAGAITTNPNK